MALFKRTTSWITELIQSAFDGVCQSSGTGPTTNYGTGFRHIAGLDRMSDHLVDADILAG